MVTETKQIMDKLDAIEADIHYIKSHLADMDVVLTEDDI